MLNYSNVYRVAVFFAVLMSVMNAFGILYDVYYVVYSYSFYVHFVAGLFLGAFWVFLFKRAGVEYDLIRGILATLVVALLWEVAELVLGVTSFSDYDYWFNNGLDVVLAVFANLLMHFVIFRTSLFRKDG